MNSPSMPAQRAARPLARSGSALPDGRLRVMVVIAILWVPSWFVIRGWLPEAWRTVGSTPLYLTGVLGLALLLVPVLFSWNKRMGTAAPHRWFVAHVACGIAGWMLIVVHTGGNWWTPPFLLVVLLTAVIALGFWGRTRAVRLSAGTFGTKIAGFSPPDEATRALLRALISEKTVLLRELDTSAREGTFSVSLPHLLRRPRLAWRYWRLERREQLLLGTRTAVSRAQGRWRLVHLLLGWTMLLGTLAHVLLVTFFAGYVAGYGPIHWWHITAS